VSLVLLEEHAAMNDEGDRHVCPLEVLRYHAVNNNPWRYRSYNFHLGGWIRLEEKQIGFWLECVMMETAGWFVHHIFQIADIVEDGHPVIALNIRRFMLFQVDATKFVRDKAFFSRGASSRRSGKAVRLLFEQRSNH
jgi:hypothetical protein